MSKYQNSRPILTYDDVIPYPPGNDQQPMVDVATYDDTIVSRYDKPDMIAYTGQSIYLRDQLARRLAQVSTHLAPLGYRLKIVYGYRHPEIQEKYFLAERAQIVEQYPDKTAAEIDRLTHGFVAIPDVAGHPTGGAVDLTMITSDGQDVDMGTIIADYSDPDKIITFGHNLTAAQSANRKLLLDAMLNVGFAPFYGEWWHFSYGDREWAAFYDQPSALFEQVSFRH